MTRVPRLAKRVRTVSRTMPAKTARRTSNRNRPPSRPSDVRVGGSDSCVGSTSGLLGRLVRRSGNYSGALAAVFGGDVIASRPELARDGVAISSSGRWLRRFAPRNDDALLTTDHSPLTTVH